MSTEAKRLAELSRAVRESSLKRLRRVPAGREGWAPVEGAMSFADLARHLGDADLWLLRKLVEKDLAPMVGEAGSAGEIDRRGYLGLIERLDELGRRRAETIGRLTDHDLAERIPDRRFGGEVSVWWVIARGNLDHEIHHRGQLAAYLRLLGE